MKLRLLTTAVAMCCLNASAFAEELDTGYLTEKTAATATIEFVQPSAIVNTLTPETNLELNKVGVRIATGKIALADKNSTARLALQSESTNKSDRLFRVYAEGHKGDSDYVLAYKSIPDDSQSVNYDITGDGATSAYLVSPTDISTLSYSVLATTPKKAGRYNISVIGAIYIP